MSILDIIAFAVAGFAFIAVAGAILTVRRTRRMVRTAQARIDTVVRQLQIRREGDPT